MQVRTIVANPIHIVETNIDEEFQSVIAEMQLNGHELHSWKMTTHWDHDEGTCILIVAVFSSIADGS